MTTLRVRLEALTGAPAATLIGRDWALIGHPTATSSPDALLVGGESTLRTGVVAALMFDIEDVPSQDDDSDAYLELAVVGVGRWFFQVPDGAMVVDVATQANLFVTPVPLGPRPGPRGDPGWSSRGNPGDDGPEGSGRAQREVVPLPDRLSLSWTADAAG